MDNLRLILLAIGAVFVVGIYVWEISRRDNKSKQQDPLSSGFTAENLNHTDFDQQDLDMPMQHDHEADSVADYADLGAMLTRERNQILNKSSNEDERLTDFYNADDIAAIESEVSDELKEQPSRQETTIPAQDVLVLYIKARYDRVISGMEIKRAAKECNLAYGAQHVFHYYGVTNPDTDAEPLFSMANLYEPGEFDMEQMHRLRTKGLALFMYPPKKDSFQIFEKFIGTVQRLAASLAAEIHKYDHTALTKWDIDQLRKKYYQ